MTIQILISFLPYAFITALTPGPNNILALSSVSLNGWRRSVPILLGIIFGFLGVMVLCAVACFELGRTLPAITGFLKYIGAAYLVWLALHIVFAKSKGSTQTNGASFWTGFFLQFVNIKIILYAFTVYSAYVLPFSQTLGILLLTALVNSMVGCSGILTWACMGSVLQNIINKYHLVFNLLMASILLWCAISLFLPA